MTKVLICSGSPDRLSNNAVLRSYVARGFSALIGAGAVVSCSYDTAEAHLETFRPNVILVFGSCMPASVSYLRLKRYCMKNDALLAFWLHDDPYEFDYNYKINEIADLIFTNDQWAATHYERDGVFHLPLAADPTAHFRKRPATYARDLFFCGVGFPNRVSLLHDCGPALSGLNVMVRGAGWPQSMKFASNERVLNEELADFYADSLVTLNVGRTHDLANRRFMLVPSTPGPRTFEAAMSGAVQCIFVEGLEIEQYFDPENGEVLLFDSPSELRRHIDSLRDDPARALQLGLAAQGRALSAHTYRHRAQVVLEKCMDVGVDKRTASADDGPKSRSATGGAFH